MRWHNRLGHWVDDFMPRVQGEASLVERACVRRCWFFSWPYQSTQRMGCCSLASFHKLGYESRGFVQYRIPARFH